MISFVYFDLGGVIDKDFSATKKWDDLREELEIEPSRAYEMFWSEVERDICTKKEVDDLLPILADRFGAKISPQYSLLDTFVKRFERNESIWPVLTKIKQTTRIGLLTNMYPHMLDAIKMAGILPSIEWNAIVDSSVEGFMKPDKEFFQIAEEKAGVTGKEILFVDNSAKHIAAAQEFGWQTFFYDSSNYERSSEELLEFWESLS